MRHYTILYLTFRTPSILTTTSVAVTISSLDLASILIITFGASDVFLSTRYALVIPLICDLHSLMTFLLDLSSQFINIIPEVATVIIWLLKYHLRIYTLSTGHCVKVHRTLVFLSRCFKRCFSIKQRYSEFSLNESGSIHSNNDQQRL